MTKTPPVELEFSRKYDRSHSEQYLKKHHEGWARRLSHWRDEQVARHALRLADDPGLVLDHASDGCILCFGDTQEGWCD